MTALPTDNEGNAPTESGRSGDSTIQRLIRIAVPVLMLVLLVVVWAIYVYVYDVPHYILPSPTRVAQRICVRLADTVGRSDGDVADHAVGA